MFSFRSENVAYFSSPRIPKCNLFLHQYNKTTSGNIYSNNICSETISDLYFCHYRASHRIYTSIVNALNSFILAAKVSMSKIHPALRVLWANSVNFLTCQNILTPDYKATSGCERKHNEQYQSLSILHSLNNGKLFRGVIGPSCYVLYRLSKKFIHLLSS